MINQPEKRPLSVGLPYNSPTKGRQSTDIFSKGRLRWRSSTKTTFVRLASSGD